MSTPLLPVADAALALLADVQRTCTVQRTVWERDADELDEHSYYEDDEQGEQEGAARAAALAVAAAREGPQLAAAAALCECCVRFLMAHHGAVLGTLDGAGLLRPGLKLRPEHTRHAELLQQVWTSGYGLMPSISACPHACKRQAWQPATCNAQEAINNATVIAPQRKCISGVRLRKLAA